MIIQKELIIPTGREKDIVADITYKEESVNSPLVVFCHGYKGFKDWGAWNLVAETFARNGFSFLKFNFSHNGGTIDSPIDFPDLDTFGKNTYTKEVEDLHTVLAWTQMQTTYSFNKNNITLIGHSRGGGIALIGAKESSFVRRVITWAAVSDFKKRFIKGELLDKWKESGVYYIKNGRTKQKMPHFYSFYEDFIRNEHRLNIKSCVKQLYKPFLIIHGTNDEAVDVQEALNLKSWNPIAQLVLIENAGHTFGSKHPWEQDTLPKDLQEVVETSIRFIDSE